MYRLFIKKTLDILIALIGIIVLLPAFIITTLLLVIMNQGKPFFTQLRPGKDGKIFKIIKFKTMTDRKDSNGRLLPDSDRLTRIGAIIRKLSLDELPQLLNVLKGDMSLVGPRPLLPEYLKLYTKEQARRHEVKPGITGWAQVNGRNALSWEKKFELDVWYVTNQNILLDLKILFLTIKKVIFKENINSAGQATTTPFTGT